VGGAATGFLGYGWTVAVAAAAIAGGGVLAAFLVTGRRDPRPRRAPRRT
jgi:hypothetical protein